MVNKWMSLMSVTGLAVAMVACAPAMEDSAAVEDEKVEEVAATTAPAAPRAPAQAAAPAAPAVCANCGTVTNIETVTEKGEGSGIGAVAGAVMGGVIGHQFGGGSGQKVATAAGAIGGAAAGHEVEKRRNSSTFYRVTVRMDEGGSRVVNLGAPGGISVGTPVRVVGNNIELR